MKLFSIFSSDSSDKTEQIEQEYSLNTLKIYSDNLYGLLQAGIGCNNLYELVTLISLLAGIEKYMRRAELTQYDFMNSYSFILVKNKLQLKRVN